MASVRRNEDMVSSATAGLTGGLGSVGDYSPLGLRLRRVMNTLVERVLITGPTARVKVEAIQPEIGPGKCPPDSEGVVVSTKPTNSPGSPQPHTP